MDKINRKQAEIEKTLLEHEKQAFKDLKTAYKNAEKDIRGRILNLQNSLNDLKAIDTKGFDDRSKEILESQIQSKVYQLEYQKMLDRQINSCIEVLKQDTVTNVSSYLYKVYEDSYLGSLYNINAAGIPITTPINPSLLVATVNKPTGTLKFSKFGQVTKKDKDGLTYIQRIERNMNDFKKKVKAEISRGLANGSSYNEISQMLSMVTGEDIHVSERIVRTEGTRVSTEARLTQIRAAKEKGADLVKVWDSTLDGKTRTVHRHLDQQVREVDEPFKADGYETMGPGMFGDPSQDCNCRCCVLSVPRWDLEDINIRTDNETGDLIEVKNYTDWKQGYFRRVTEEELIEMGKETLEKNISILESNAVLNKAVEKIRNAKKENLIIADKDGNIIRQEGGNSYHTGYGSSEDDYKGNITIHNHPNTVYPYPSKQDFKTLEESGMLEMFVVSKNFTISYGLDPEYKGHGRVGLSYFVEQNNYEIGELQKSINEETVKAYKEGKYSSVNEYKEDTIKKQSEAILKFYEELAKKGGYKLTIKKLN